MIRIGRADTLRAALVVGALAVTLPSAAAAEPSEIAGAAGERFAPGEVLVRYEPGTSPRERAEVRDELDAELQRRLLVPRLELLSLEPGDSVGAAVTELRGEANVAYAEPNFIYRLAAEPTDPAYTAGALWGLDNNGIFGGSADADIDAPEAWLTTTGLSDVIVGVVDSGIAMDHPDLDSNIWVNDAEDTGLAATDDEPNGFVDDTSGWDFVSGDNDPSDREGHGTHVAGTIGAEADNPGGDVVGVNWDVQLMPLRACNELGSCTDADVTDALAYAGANGAQVVNVSISGSIHSAAQASAIAAAPNTLFVVAAGNEGANNDVSPRYPCNYPGANLICVGATNWEDNLASFSNRGTGSVDIAAPGGGAPGAFPARQILSTYALLDRANETFEAPLGGNWDNGGFPPTWARTTEASELPGGTLTDSPGANYADDTDSYARLGPIDLSADSGCYLRYDLALSIPDLDDHLVVEVSTDDVTYTTLQDWTGFGASTLTPDLSIYSGEPSVYIRFRMVSDNNVVGDGAHIDNVRVRCPAPVYAYLQGTSMASPHVAGTAALLLAQTPAATVSDLREWLLDGVDPKSSLTDAIGSGGRLNAARSLQGAIGNDIHRPQTTIVSGPALTSTTTSASFSFAADEPGSFACSQDGAAFAPCSSPKSLSTLAIGAHSFDVKAIDAAGNEDATPAHYSFIVQATPESSACRKARKKLRNARTHKQKRKLRKLVKKKCAPAAAATKRAGRLATPLGADAGPVPLGAAAAPSFRRGSRPGPRAAP